MEISLSVSEKAALEAQHRKTRDSRESDRIKAVLLRSEGWTIVMISQALRLNESTISRHLQDYLGAKKLKPANGGSEGKLNPIQSQQLIHHLMNNIYSKVQHIIAVVKLLFKVDFSLSGMNKWLTRHHFRYKKPKGIPHRLDAEKQKQFIEKYNKLKSKLKEEDIILFMDAMHPTQNTKLSYGWIRKGHEKPIKTTGSRTRLNIVGAMNLNQMDQTLVRHYETINSETIGDFLTLIREYHHDKKNIYLIMDGAAYHKSHFIADKAKDLRIELIFLPPYSPNLNPIERLWKVMNNYVRNNQYFASKAEFTHSVMTFFTKTLSIIAGRLGATINDNFQSIKPAS